MKMSILKDSMPYDSIYVTLLKLKIIEWLLYWGQELYSCTGLHTLPQEMTVTLKVQQSGSLR